VGVHQARRREIVFAVCCAESYLYEWAFAQVRAASSANDLEANTLRHLSDSVLMLGFNKRWARIMGSLHSEGLLTAIPEVESRGHRQQWEQLLTYRNGLVHAAISQPVFGSGPVSDPPVTNSHLATLAPGWAVSVVAERIRRLHVAAGTAPPTWLVDP
jgi:hypothetical protein